MHFLIDADLPRSIAQLLERYGHSSTDVREIGLGSAPDHEVIAYAVTNDLCLLSGDFGFADIRNYPPGNYSGIVVFEFPPHRNREIILQLVEALFEQPHVVQRLPGRLAIVEPTRIRLRPV